VRAYGGDAKRVSNWLMNDVLRMINDLGVTASELKLRPAYLAEIIKLVDASTINNSTGKSLLVRCRRAGGRRGKSCRPRGCAGQQRRSHPRGGAGHPGGEPEGSAGLPGRQGNADGLVRGPGDAPYARQGGPGLTRAVLEEMLGEVMRDEG